MYQVIEKDCVKKTSEVSLFETILLNRPIHTREHMAV